MTKFYDDYLALPDVLLLEAARDSGDELAVALGKRLEQEIEERAREVERLAVALGKRLEQQIEERAREVERLEAALEGGKNT